MGTGPEHTDSFGKPALSAEVVGNISEQCFVDARLRRVSRQIRRFADERFYLEAAGYDATGWLAAKLEERSALLQRTRPSPLHPAPHIVLPGSGSWLPRTLRPGLASDELLGTGPWMRLPFLPWGEGINPPATATGASGSIDTVALYPGPDWKGSLSLQGGERGHGAWWIHTWHTMVAFPPATVPSLLMYRFDQAVSTFLFHEDLHGSIHHFVAVGEVPKLSDNSAPTGGSEAWPLWMDFPDENGSRYGELQGVASVAGEIGVREGWVPALAIVAGTIASVEQDGTLDVLWGQSFPRLPTTAEHQHPTTSDFGFLEYRYVPEQVLAPLLRT